jgi:hypothetical protein
MADTQDLSDHELVNVSHQWRRLALQGSNKAVAIEQARLHEAELRRRFGEVDRSVRLNGSFGHRGNVKMASEPMTITEAANDFIIATADSATQSAEALRELLHNLRVLLEMDIAFVAEFVDAKKIYRHIDNANKLSTYPKVGDSAPLEITLCQRVVDGRLPTHSSDAQTHPEMGYVKTTNASSIKAYLSAPVVLRDGRTYGTLCCISHTPRSALGSRQIDSLRYVAGIVAAELEKRGK